MTNAPPRPLANRYIRIPIINTTSHLLLNSSALIFRFPLLTRAINENSIPMIPVIKGSNSGTYGRNRSKGLSKMVRMPSTRPKIPPRRIKRSPIFFKSLILDYSLLLRT